ncbi:MAG TPA: uroporphyrinogen decarboxylase family protein [Chloroflexota bacterium]|nr:uroporphyrinogen decarboxylase family protein [Chloroflexota bacterium]
MTYTVEPDPRLVEKFGRDTVSFYPGFGAGYELKIDPETNTYSDEWGVKYRMPPDGYYFDPFQFPLAKAETPADLDRHRWPDPHDLNRIRGIAEEIKATVGAGEKAILLGAPTLGLWMLPQFLRGMEQALMDLAGNKKLAEALAEKITEWYEEYWDSTLAVVGPYVDFVHMEGDLGDQNGPLFSPKTFREIYKPRLRRVVDAIKRRSSARIWLHSCGSIYWAIPDLIDAGVEVLNPVQVNAAEMDSARLKREFGKDLTFWGGGCDPVVLQCGSPSDVEADVRRRIADFAPGGGFVFASVHNIQANVPPANIVAMFEAAHRYGIYR